MRNDRDEKTAVYTSHYAGRTYHFCIPGCKRCFDKEPERYLDPKTPREPHNGHA